MAKLKTLLINGKKVYSKDVTIDDLKVLCKQFHEKYNKTPTSVDYAIKNNLPLWMDVKKLFDLNNLSHEEFLASLGYKNNKKKYPDVKVGNIYGRWKVIKALGKRKTGKRHYDTFWLCECSCGSGKTGEVSSNALKTGNSTSCGCVQLESINKLKGTIRKQNFEDWCIENNHDDFLNRWDYEKNSLTPSEVSYCAHQKFFFKCPSKKHESTSYELSHVSSMKILRCKYCDSFARRFINIRGENALEKYWDYDKNKESPWDIPGSSRKKVWLKCIDTDYHGSYQITRDSAIRGVQCPYCSNMRIHPKDSFAQLLIDRYTENGFKKIWNKEKNTVNPFKIAPSTRKYKVWLNCIDVDYHPPTLAYPNDVKNHTGYCHYCAKELVCKEDSLGYLYPETLDVWSDKNKKTPYEYFPNSNQKTWWKCKSSKHEDFLRRIADANIGTFGCPECSNEKTTSKLQDKVSEYILNTYGYKMLHEHKCRLKPRNPKTNHMLPYDNELQELKLIIEVHGKQHYEVTGFTMMTAKYYNTTPEKELEKYQKRDKYKMQYALSNGYNYLEIPYWTEEDESYMTLIDNKIKEIINEVA